MSPLDHSDEAKEQRRLEKQKLREAAEGYALPMPEKLERNQPAPEREILTARETLERERGNRKPLKTAAKGAVGLLIAVALFVGVYFAASAFDNAPPIKSAAWGTKSAPSVKPESLDGQ